MPSLWLLCGVGQETATETVESLMVRIGGSFEFEIRDRHIKAIGTVYDIELKPATKQCFVTFRYSLNDKEDELTVDLRRFFEIIVQRQQTL